MVNKIKMQRFAFPPQIRPAWKRQKKQKHGCLRGIFVSDCKVRKKNPIITENQPLSYVGDGRKLRNASTCPRFFFWGHELFFCPLGKKSIGQKNNSWAKKRGACRVARPSSCIIILCGADWLKSCRFRPCRPTCRRQIPAVSYWCPILCRRPRCSPCCPGLRSA